MNITEEMTREQIAVEIERLQQMLNDMHDDSEKTEESAPPAPPKTETTVKQGFFSRIKSGAKSFWTKVKAKAKTIWTWLKAKSNVVAHKIGTGTVYALKGIGWFLGRVINTVVKFVYDVLSGIFVGLSLIVLAIAFVILGIVAVIFKSVQGLALILRGPSIRRESRNQWSEMWGSYKDGWKFRNWGPYTLTEIAVRETVREENLREQAEQSEPKAQPKPKNTRHHGPRKHQTRGGGAKA